MEIIRTTRRRILLGAAISLLAVGGAIAFPTVYKTGLTIAKPGVQAGYVMISANGSAYAIDTKGEVAMKWTAPAPYTGLGYARPLANGNILAGAQGGRPGGGGGRGNGTTETGGTIIEFTQDGQLVWKYTETERLLHHDFERMPSGNTLMVCSKYLMVPSVSKQLLKDDCLVEVDPQGKVVWDWQTTDHYKEMDLPQSVRDEVMNGYGEKPVYAGSPPPSAGMDWGHVNAASPIPEGTGLTDPRFKPGNIIVSYRPLSLLVVIDHDTKKIVWQTTGISIGQHNVHFIPPGVPGTGHILIFDNGYNSPAANPRHQDVNPNSSIVEYDPIAKSIVWRYTAEMSGLPIWSFFSDHIGGVQRQPNGNTLICEGVNGRVFEVTPKGEIVWEYVNPFQKAGKIADSSLFRAAKVPESWLKHHL